MLWPRSFLMLFTSPLSVGRRQPVSSASQTPTLAQTSAIVITSNTIVPSAIITSDTATSAAPTVVTITTPISTRSPETQPPITHPSTTSHPPPSSFPPISTTTYPQVTDQDATVTVTFTSTRIAGQVATTTIFSTTISTVVVASTNFVTTTITSSKIDTATATRYVTVTAVAKRSVNVGAATPTANLVPRRRATSPEREMFQGLAKRSTFFITVTKVVTQVSDSTVTVTQMVIHQTSVLTTINVAVTSVVYPGARTTVTVDSTLTVTSTSVSVGPTTVVSTASPTGQATTATMTTTATSTPAAAADTRGLSTGVKVGIGAGVGAAVLLLLVLLAVLLLRRRRRNRPDPWAFDPTSGMAQQLPNNRVNHFEDLSGMTAHHGLAELDLRQPTIPDEAAIFANVARKSGVYSTVGGHGNPPPPRYGSGMSAVTGVAELPMPDEDGSTQEGRRQGYARAWSEPEPGRPELQMSQTIGGPGRWSRQTRVSSKVSELDSACQRVQHGRYNHSSSASTSELEGGVSSRESPGYQHQPLQAHYEMPHQRFE